jgi:hypothetical protein
MLENTLPSSLRPSVLASVIVIFAELLLIMLLVPNSWLTRIVETETRMVNTYMGESAGAWIDRTASSWYQGLVTANRLEDHARSMFLPTHAEKVASRGLEQLGDSLWFPWVEGRIRAFFTLVGHVLYRAATIATWAPFLPVFLIPALIDGWVKWRIRQHGFSYPSPLMHRVSTATVAYAILITIILLFAPLPLPSWLLPGLVVVSFVSLVVMVANAQKRL